MRISDWSSDVCSSDLPVEKRCPFRQAAEAGQMEEGRAGALAPDAAGMTVHIDGLGGEMGHGLLLGARASRPLSREAQGGRGGRAPGSRPGQAARAPGEIRRDRKSVV